MARFDRSSCRSVRSWEARHRSTCWNWKKPKISQRFSNEHESMNELQCQNQERSIGNWTSFSCSWKLTWVEGGGIWYFKWFQTIWKTKPMPPKVWSRFCTTPREKLSEPQFLEPIFFWGTLKFGDDYRGYKSQSWIKNGYTKLLLWCG